MSGSPKRSRRKHYITQKSLLISALQKTVRRELPEQALSTASALVQHHPKAFTRRLPIILLEDCMLHPRLPDLIRIMISVSRNQPLAQADVSLLLTVVNDLCKVEVRDIVDRNMISRYSRSQPKSKFGPEATSLLDAIRIRLRYGGMRDDMEMMLDFIKMWTVRFAEDEKHWLDFIAECYPKTGVIEPNRVPALKLNDILLEAVDFHCSPMIPVLLKKQGLEFQIFRLFGRASPEKVLRDVIWTMRSSVNKRPVHWDRSIPVDLIDRLDSDTRKRYLELYRIIEPELDGIARWYIQKVREQERNSES